MALAPGLEDAKDIARYSSLGLIGNPFAAAAAAGSDDLPTACEVAAASNALLNAILAQSREDAPKPLWVEKSAEVPSYYPMAATAGAEEFLATDDSLNVLYAYVQLYTMKIGVVRTTLGLLAERLSFRSFDRTLVAYVEKILAEPDTGLASYQVMGPEGLASFGARFREDPLDAVHACLGAPEYERRPELAEVADPRQRNMDEDVVDETDSTNEIDATLGDAPGTTRAMTEQAEDREGADELGPVRDYVIEHARAHLSSVVARALRVYHDRGLVAMSQEFKVTKAPRKTLAAVVKLARFRFRKVALLYDSFEQWGDIDPDLRSKILGLMSDMRWKLAGDAFFVVFSQLGVTPELEDTFRSGRMVDWTFADLATLQERPDTIDPKIVDHWLTAATLPEGQTLSMRDPVLKKLAELSGGSLKEFAAMSLEAIENAASRGVDHLDDASLEAGAAVSRRES
jgi:hypothetical protein